MLTARRAMQPTFNSTEEAVHWSLEKIAALEATNNHLQGQIMALILILLTLREAGVECGSFTEKQWDDAMAVSMEVAKSGFPGCPDSDKIVASCVNQLNLFLSSSLSDAKPKLTIVTGGKGKLGEKDQT